MPTVRYHRRIPAYKKLIVIGPADKAGVLKQMAVSWDLQLGKLTKYTNNSDSRITEAWANISAPPGKS